MSFFEEHFRVVTYLSDSEGVFSESATFEDEGEARSYVKNYDLDHLSYFPDAPTVRYFELERGEFVDDEFEAYHTLTASAGAQEFGDWEAFSC